MVESWKYFKYFPEPHCTASCASVLIVLPDCVAVELLSHSLCEVASPHIVRSQQR
jgi:hypothetical protein